MTEKDILKVRVEGRILTYLNRVKSQYQPAIYQAVGRGLEPQEFITICDKLVEQGTIKRTDSVRDSVILRWVE